MAKYSGQIDVPTAGTAVAGPNVANPGGFYVKAHPSNTGAVWVGDDGNGTVAATTGYPLNPGEQIIAPVSNLNQLWFNASVSGEDVCWHKA